MDAESSDDTGQPAISTSFGPIMRTPLVNGSCVSGNFPPPPEAVEPFSLKFLVQFENVTGWMS